MKKQVMMGVCALVLWLMPHVLQASVWYMETDTEVSIPMENVDYLMVADDNQQFSVVQKDGSLVNSVRSVTFTQRQATAVDTPTEMEIQLFPNPVVNVLNLNGLREGQTVSVLSIDGRVLITERSIGQHLSLSVAELPQGIYFLRTDNSTIKFVKH